MMDTDATLIFQTIVDCICMEKFLLDSYITQYNTLLKLKKTLTNPGGNTIKSLNKYERYMNE